MVMISCPECGKQVSSKAGFCPHCGYGSGASKGDGSQTKAKPKTGCVTWICTALVLLFFWAAMCAPNPDGDRAIRSDYPRPAIAMATPTPVPSPTATPTPIIHRERENVDVGYMSYKVMATMWSDTLGQEPIVRKADATYLCIDIIATNRDKQERNIPAFCVVDKKGNTYNQSSEGIYLQNSLSLMDSVNPGVGKRGVVVFDLPKGNAYQLVVLGDYWAQSKALIALEPKDIDGHR